jgi:hypothetical protein
MTAFTCAICTQSIDAGEDHIWIDVERKYPGYDGNRFRAYALHPRYWDAVTNAWCYPDGTGGQ